MSKVVRIGVINLMPEAEKYPPVLQQVFPDYVELIWIRLKGHPYRSSDQDYLNRTHLYFEPAMLANLDGIIVTGAPLDDKPFEVCHYWDELRTIVEASAAQVGSVMGICWGAMAVGKILYDLDTAILGQKLYGIYGMRSLVPNHPLHKTCDELIFYPQSRFAAIDMVQLRALEQQGHITLLDHHPKVGASLICSNDQRVVLQQGHPEYPTERLRQEYMRHREKQGGDYPQPFNYDLIEPLNCWQLNGKAFFTAWAGICKKNKESREYE
ncbi:homoserine O-acetyltransferase/O-succinyltransferase family protein [Pseudoalteromonas viridis]|uniref:Homoserine O-acetyltransferase n=1 Tax=Pseudoalteromonas viridis TaxID=339617 RepID=A0ABX7V6Y8_9GAMM|nr:homoserine O-succinyltransferase [Pseudoalteromonas viridis]QTL36673.1 homoserine O-succinyltransferase [Pseudoalteromonas viridis]